MAGIPKCEAGLEITTHGDEYRHRIPLSLVMIPCSYAKGILPGQENLLLPARAVFG
jgi:hypothetical protein